MDSFEAIAEDAIVLLKEWEVERSALISHWQCLDDHPEIGRVSNPVVVGLEKRFRNLEADPSKS